MQQAQDKLRFAATAEVRSAPTLQTQPAEFAKIVEYDGCARDRGMAGRIHDQVGASFLWTLKRLFGPYVL